MVHLLIKCLDEITRNLYKNHKTYYEGDCGLDLFCFKEHVVPAGQTMLLNLGIQAAAFVDKTCTKPCGWLIFPRSSISKTPLRLCNSIGLIDAGYRGELMAAVDNIKTFDYTVKSGDRLVQAVGFHGEPVTFEIVEELDKTQRGTGGFGSTGS